MVTQFTPRVFFLSVSNDLLKSYFAHRGELLDVPWERFTLSSTDPVHEAWRALPPASRDAVEAELRAIAELGTPDGLRLVTEEARVRGIALPPPPVGRRGGWDYALRVFLEHREIFEVARRFDRADRLNGRYWRRRTGLPRVAPDVSPGACVSLGAAVAAYFQHRDDRGQHCAVRWDVRGGTRHYFVAYPQDAAEVVAVYDARGELVHDVCRRPFLVVFVWDEADGTLEVHAKGDRRLHTDLQQVFARVILDQDLPPESQPAPPYRLNLLKRRDFVFPIEAGEGIADVRVKELRVALLGGGRVNFDAEHLRRQRNVYDLLEPAMRGYGLPLSNVDVDRVQLQLAFDFTRGSRVLPVVMTPYHWSLRDGPEHVVAKRLLTLAGLACA